MYNLGSRRGEWSAHDDHIWTAMQPALQMASRILNLNHPFWRSVQSIYARRPVKPSRDPRPNEEKQKFPLMNLVEMPDLTQPHPIPAMERLRQLGFDLDTSAVMGFLEDRLVLEVVSSIRPGGGDPKKGSVWNPCWGETWVEGGTRSADAVIFTGLGAEFMWPLLVPDYTSAEKACISMCLAATIVHECAHAAEMALHILCHDPVAYRTQIKQLAVYDDEVLEQLHEAAKDYTAEDDNAGYESYWMDLPLGELGFAFEQELFGGTITSASKMERRMFPHVSHVSLTVAMDDWPGGRRPLRRELDRKTLHEYPMPVETTRHMIPVPMANRPFQQEFWTTGSAKFGHGLLRFDSGPAKLTSTCWRAPTRFKDIKKAFGYPAAKWTRKTLNTLSNAGYGIVELFLRETVTEKVGFVTVHKRWHFEQTTWARLSQVFDDMRSAFIVAGTDLTGSAAWATLMNSNDAEKQELLDERQADWDHWHGSGFGLEQEQPPQTLALYISELTIQVLNLTRPVVMAGTDICSFAQTQLQNIQIQVEEYLRQNATDRKKLWRHYGHWISNRMETQVTDFTSFITELEALNEAFDRRGFSEDVRLVNPPQVNVAEEIPNLTNTLKMLVTNFNETKVYFHDSYITNVQSEPVKFRTVPSGMYMQRSQMLRKLAEREITLMHPLIRAVVQTFLKLVRENTSDRAEGASVDDLTATLQRKIRESVASQATSAPGLMAIFSQIQQAAAPQQQQQQQQQQQHQPPGTLPPNPNLGIFGFKITAPVAAAQPAQQQQFFPQPQPAQPGLATQLPVFQPQPQSQHPSYPVPMNIDPTPPGSRTQTPSGGVHPFPQFGIPAPLRPYTPLSLPSSRPASPFDRFATSSGQAPSPFGPPSTTAGPLPVGATSGPFPLPPTGFTLFDPSQQEHNITITPFGHAYTVDETVPLDNVSRGEDRRFVQRMFGGPEQLRENDARRAARVAREAKRQAAQAASGKGRGDGGGSSRGIRPTRGVGWRRGIWAGAMVSGRGRGGASGSGAGGRGGASGSGSGSGATGSGAQNP
ncbi:hypothetical protein B0T22DRAFT_511112 [Podospora appendiculata]|uniref:Uncharacterized protein n=1 Tax=Podospora appendiculata TaxID=314037 RepID=A0AAE0X8T7_9PEZI|nr:hypothetical protein B0T22DRAFT_511112 [Podospora appendiculata]